MKPVKFRHLSEWIDRRDLVADGGDAIHIVEVAGQFGEGTDVFENAFFKRREDAERVAEAQRGTVTVLWPYRLKDK